MAKQYNIRWTENQQDQLRKAVKNFNAKVKRLEEKYNNDSKVVIPERVTMREMKEIIGTRGDLQREVRSLQSFTKRGAEELISTQTDSNISITKWQNKDLKRRAKMINNMRDIKREEYLNRPVIDRGKVLDYTNRAIMGDTKLLQFEHTTPITKTMGKADFHYKMKHYRYEGQDKYWNIRDQQMIENYIQTIKDNFSYNDVKAVIDKIESLSIDKAKEIIYSDPQKYASAYPGADKNDEEKHVRALHEMWDVPYNESSGSTKARNITKSKKRK